MRVTPGRAVRRAGRRASRRRSTPRYYFGQPVANGKVAYVAHKQPYYSPLRWSDDEDEGGGGYWYGDDQVVEGEARLDANGNATIEVPAERRRQRRATTACASRRGSPTPATAKSPATRWPTRPSGTFLIAAVDRHVRRAAGRHRHALGACRELHRACRRRRRRSASPCWRDRQRPMGRRRAALREVTHGHGDDRRRGPRRVDGARARRRPATTACAPAPQSGGAHRSADDSYLWVPGARAATDEDYGYDKYLELIAEKKTVQPGETVAAS